MSTKRRRRPTTRRPSTGQRTGQRTGRADPAAGSTDTANAPGSEDSTGARVSAPLGRPRDAGNVPEATRSPPLRPGRAPQDRRGSTGRRPASQPAQVSVAEELHVPPHGCAGGVLADVDPQGVAVTYSFDTSDWPRPGAVAIGFAGTRLHGADQPGDRFERIERIGGLDPRTGRVTVTTRVQHLNHGSWRIIAGPVEVQPPGPLPRVATVTSTQFAPLAQGPGVRLFAWPALVGLGAVVAVIVQALLVARAGLPVFPVVALSALGCLLGYPAGKVWYLVVNRRPPREFLVAGACIQGFLLAALTVVAGGALVLDLSVGTILDATAPGVFLGIAIGRPGCFLTGCCAGRPTTSRWALWSSDRRLGIRRIPVQLYEAAIAVAIGVAGLLLVLTTRSPFPGAAFVATTAAYTFSRQLLFRLRSQSHTRLGRLVTQAVCATLLLGVLAAFVAR